MKETAVESSNTMLTTLPLLLALGLFFAGLGGYLLYQARQQWRAGTATGSTSEPMTADRDSSPGLFAFLTSVRAFSGIAMLGFGALLLGLAGLYAIGMVISAATGVPL